LFIEFYRLGLTITPALATWSVFLLFFFYRVRVRFPAAEFMAAFVVSDGIFVSRTSPPLFFLPPFCGSSHFCLIPAPRPLDRYVPFPPSLDCYDGHQYAPFDFHCQDAICRRGPGQIGATSPDACCCVVRPHMCVSSGFYAFFSFFSGNGLTLSYLPTLLVHLPR